VFGFVLFLALPYMAWGSFRVWKDGRPDWLVVVVYGWYFLVLSVVQVRFAGQLSMFTAVFGGVGFVHLAAKTDLTQRSVSFVTRAKSVGDGGRPQVAELPLPDGRILLSLALLFLLVAGMGLVQTPVKQSQLNIDESTYRTATWIGNYATEQGLEYPENYVFSSWGRNRVYNYFVSGQSESYTFAQLNYEDFLQSTDPAEWYRKLERQDRNGFIVVGSGLELNDSTNYALLSERYGSGGSGTPGTGHYRALYHDPSGDTVFEAVPGSTVVTTASPNTTVTLSRPVSIPGRSFVYTRNATTSPTGNLAVRLPYSGEYAASGTENISVPSGAVATGDYIIDAGLRQSGTRAEVTRWTFDERLDGHVIDRVGPNHGRVRRGQYTAGGVDGAALVTRAQEGGGFVVDGVTAPEEFTVSFWLRPAELNTTSQNDFREVIGTGSGFLVVIEESGRISLRVPGVTEQNFVRGSAPVGSWTHVAVSYDGQSRRIYVNGTLAGQQQIDSGSPSWGGRLTVAGSADSNHAFAGRLDEIRLYDRAIGSDRVSGLYEERRDGS